MYLSNQMGMRGNDEKDGSEENIRKQENLKSQSAPSELQSPNSFLFFSQTRKISERGSHLSIAPCLAPLEQLLLT